MLARAFLRTYSVKMPFFLCLVCIILYKLLCIKAKIRNFALEKERYALASAIKPSKKERPMRRFSFCVLIG